jgi:trigger factor
LIGGDHEGQEAEVSVTVKAVKERELPEADDDFAQMASEFDTIAELRESLAGRVSQQGLFEQGSQARDALVAAILERVDVPMPQQLLDDEVHNHLESEGRLQDDVHRAEVIESTTRQFRTQVVLDAIVEQVKAEVTQEELSQYLVQSAAQYGMAPQEFFEALEASDQIPAVVAEVSRSKALSLALLDVKVVDTNGNKVDLSAILPAAQTPSETDAKDAAVAEKPAKKPAAKGKK